MEFHIDDKVVCISDLLKFKVTGVCNSPQGLLYTGDGVGWVPEKELDFDWTKEERDAMVQLEMDIYAVSHDVDALVKKIKEMKRIGFLRKTFPGALEEEIKSMSLLLLASVS